LIGHRENSRGTSVLDVFDSCTVSCLARPLGVSRPTRTHPLHAFRPQPLPLDLHHLPCGLNPLPFDLWHEISNQIGLRDDISLWSHVLDELDLNVDCQNAKGWETLQVQRTNLWIDCIEPLDGLQSIQYLSQSQDSPRNFARFCLCLLDVGVPGLGYISFLQSYSVASCVSSFCPTNLQMFTYQRDDFKDGVRSHCFVAHPAILASDPAQAAVAL
jgi:hypothetical protein